MAETRDRTLSTPQPFDEAPSATGEGREQQGPQGNPPSPADLLTAILTSLDKAKAEEIVSLDIGQKTPIADYMVVASGRSHRHVGAIADHLLEDLKESGFPAPALEGRASCDWVLIDAGDVIVHVFRPEVRHFYNVEKMWAAEAAPSRAHG